MYFSLVNAEYVPRRITKREDILRIKKGDKIYRYSSAEIDVNFISPSVLKQHWFYVSKNDVGKGEIDIMELPKYEGKKDAYYFNDTIHLLKMLFRISMYYLLYPIVKHHLRKKYEHLLLDRNYWTDY